MKKHDTDEALRAPPPSRGVVRAPRTDGFLDGRRVLPPAELAPFVHHFWVLRWALRTPFTAEALPFPAAQITLEARGKNELVGVHTERVRRTRAGTGEIFGITFRAAMFQPVMLNAVVPVASILGRETSAWARAIHATPELEAKIALASTFLQSRLRLDPRAARFRDLVEQIGGDRSVVRVEDAAGRAGLDVRALQRGFRRYVGVSPKWVIQRYRLHEAAEQLKRADAPAPAALAARLGYADQAHFSRDFKRMVGETPGSFALAWRARRSGIASPRPGL